MACLVLGACGGVIADGAGDGATSAELRVPARVSVNGRVVAVERDYLPRVVQCENPGAPFEALKAQAIAARTYLTYRTGNKTLPTISDGESDQVYTCAANQNGRFVSAEALRAVEETTGQVVLWRGAISAGFFVSGADRAANSCKRLTDPTNTEKYVTYNFGLVEGSSHASSIGLAADDHNRGCFAQRLANCLAETTEYDDVALLRYFYGSDIQVAAVGATPPTENETLVQAATDLTEATCWSGSLGRPVPVGSCVQSATNRAWYQCQPGGGFAANDAGSASGPLGACTTDFAL